MKTDQKYPGKITIRLSDAVSFDMLYIEGGGFVMGEAQSEQKNRRPAHKVAIERFYLGKYQVTQMLWKTMMKTEPSFTKGNLMPVVSISWEEVQEFIEQLNQLTKQSFRLPTEAEWEYAARGGIFSQNYIYSGSDKLSQVAWYRENSNNELQEVGQKLANELGLYDMSGNVLDWCEDDWHNSYHNAPADGRAWINAPRSARRIIRGGSFFNDAVKCRPVFRAYNSLDNRNGNIGFRLAMSLPSFEEQQ